MDQVNNWQRWLFWLLLGAFSVFFAEVFATSDPYVFFHIFGIVGVLGHYAMHLLVLAPLVIRPGRQVSFGAVYLAGVIFGLYEAYMTKVLWMPPWNAEAVRIGGVAVFPVIMLVLFWHPFYAFMAPLFVAEGLVLGSGRLFASLPERAQRIFRKPWFVPAFAVWVGLNHGANIGGPVQALASSLGTSSVVWLLIVLWHRAARGRRYDLAAMLPRRGWWWACLVLLLGYYLVFGFTILPENLPELGAQAIIWGMYLVFGGLLVRFLRRAPVEEYVVEEEERPEQEISPARRWLKFALVFAASSLASSLVLAWAGEAVMGLVWITGMGLGVYTLIYTLRLDFLRQK